MSISKKWEFALPDPGENKIEKECFEAMSDTLYTYLYSLSHHNPRKNSRGEYIEDYNYLYIDKSKDGKYPRFNVTKHCEILGITRGCYYKRLSVLEKYNLVIKTEDDDGRKVFLFPYIKSQMVLPVKTCAFFTRGGVRKEDVEDIIKLMAILKIYYYSKKKYFTMRSLRIQMGYSATNQDKDVHLQTMLAILKGFGIINWTTQRIELTNNKVEIRFLISFFNDAYNITMETFDESKKYSDVRPLTEEERREIFPLQ